MVAEVEGQGTTVRGARFGARAVLAAAALVLVAVPFGLLLFFVQDKWPPLLQVDVAAGTGCTASP
jgi:undecaprenyl-diphosphatase